MAEEAKEEPLASPEQAAAKPNDAEAPAPPTTGSRKRKQTDFFAPSDLKSPEKLVIQEVRPPVHRWARPVSQRDARGFLSDEPISRYARL